MMKRQILFVLMFAIALTVGTAFVYALDDQGNVNDPATNERANACFEDGSMAGECDTDWEWTCGWYMIRYENGIFGSSQIPAFCNSLLGTEEVSIPPTPVADVCAGPVFGFAYIYFGAANFLGSPVQVYSDSACTITYSPAPISVAYAPSGVAEASTICSTNLPGSVAILIASDVYECELIP